MARPARNRDTGSSGLMSRGNGMRTKNATTIPRAMGDAAHTITPASAKQHGKGAGTEWVPQ